MFNSQRTFVLCIAFFLGSSSAFAIPADAPDFNPTALQSETLEQVLTRLNRSHYRRLLLDDALSEGLYERFLERLDPSRIYLLEEDLKEFEPYRLKLDDALLQSDLTPAFNIFKRFQERRIDRMTFLVECIEKRFDALRFDGEEELVLSREETPWFTDRKAWDDLWYQQFKNDVLNLRLTGKTMEEIQELLERRYQGRLRRIQQINKDDVFRIYMDVFTESYDPHTSYFPPRIAENFDISMKLSYEGIGALLGLEGEYIKIARLIPAGPAEKEGTLQAGDRIVGVAQGEEDETVDVIGWRVDEAVDLIRGPKDTVVRLTILPANQPDSGSTRIVSLLRSEVKLEEQAARKKIVELQEGEHRFKIGVIELPVFYMDFEAAGQGDPDYKSSTRDVEALLAALKQEEVAGIVFDLRGNGGGSLQEACELTGLFLGGGPVVQVRDASGRIQVIRNPKEPAVYDGPLVVLVDRLSASASEIFAGAIQDTGRGLIVGSCTFGKGTVQNLTPIEVGRLKITQAKYYRISGGSTQNRGVVPDLLFPQIYDPEQIGESANEEALPWDKIPPAKYTQIDQLTPFLPELQDLHAKRIAQDPEFTYFT
ncbi:MAG: carboxy terminal-processing peptidase, partial [Planctomycetes bacterium]|nr:carboxy terminal-processing peptidase [Planctomycetota bacterium]